MRADGTKIFGVAVAGILAAALLAGLWFFQNNLPVFSGLLIMSLMIFLSVIYPTATICIMFLSLLTNDFIKPYMPNLFSPFLASLAGVFLAAVVRYLTGSVKAERADPRIWVCMVLISGWTMAYAWLEIGIFTWIAFLETALPLGTYLVFLMLLRSGSSVKWTAFSIIGAFLLAGLIMAPGLFWGSFYLQGGLMRSVAKSRFGTLDTATSVAWLFNLAAALALGGVVRARGGLRLAWMALYTLFSGVALMTFSRGAVVGTAAGLLAAVWLNLRKRGVLELFWSLVIFAAVFTAFYHSPMWEYFTAIKTVDREVATTGLSRYWLAINALHDIAANPWFGQGNIGSPSHSYFLDWAWQYGIPITLVVCYLLYRLLRRSWLTATLPIERQGSTLDQSLRAGCFIGCVVTLVQDIFDPTLKVFTYAIIFFAMRAIEAYYWRRDRAAASQPAVEAPAKPLTLSVVPSLGDPAACLPASRT